MKKISLFAIAALFFLTGGTQLSTGHLQSQTPVVIIITDEGTTGNIPRSPANVPIQGVVIGNTVYLSFLSDLGIVEVTLEEEGSGILCHDYYDSSELFAELTFDGFAGDYIIHFKLPGNVEYKGSFNITI